MGHSGLINRASASYPHGAKRTEDQIAVEEDIFYMFCSVGFNNKKIELQLGQKKLLHCQYIVIYLFHCQ